MMLKPFRIRSLYDTSPGVIQLTGVQYDATIRSQPDAALLYIDDDDGETILVGSSLELEQRLDELIPSHSICLGSALSVGEDKDGSMHTFDITKSPASLAIWREHEAYTSKALRKSPLKSPGSSDLSANLATMNCGSMLPPLAPQTQTDLPVSLEDAVKGALRGLETQVGAFAGFLQHTSNTLRTAAENTRDADVDAIGGVIDGFKGIFSEVGKVGKAMVEAFDADAFTLSPGGSQAVVEDPISKKPGTERSEVAGSINSSGMSATGSHHNVQARASTLAEADSSPKPTGSSRASLPANRPRDEIFPLAPQQHAKVIAKLPTRSRASTMAPYIEATLADKPNAKFPEQDAPRKQFRVFPEALEDVNTSSSILVKSTRLASSAEASPPQPTSAPFAAYASLKDPWKISSGQGHGPSFTCTYCQMLGTQCRRSFSGGGCQTCVLEQQPCSFLADQFRGASGAVSIASNPTARPHADTRGWNSDELAAQESRPSQQLNAQHNDQMQLPRETAKTYAQSSKANTSRSILDLENSDPDFSTRYPPLISLRKSKTIASLADRSRSPFLANINPEAAISRFPSLSQIEREARSDRHVEPLNEDQGASPTRWSFVKERHNLQQPAARPRLVIPARSSVDVAPATSPKLPGAWPEPRPEGDGPTLPTSEESSGAFFDRMTRSRSPEPAVRSFRYIPAHIRPSRTAGAPFAPRHSLEPLKVDTTNVPPHLRHSFSVDSMAPQLGRSNTVSASNPAARLTRPFDPLEDTRLSREMNGLPRRSGTERYRRRPYNESFTGAGRMPWESFERISQNERSEAAKREPRPNRREVKAFSSNSQSSAVPGFGISDKVGECVKRLRDMGYGNRSPHEANRLSIYAAACNGDIADAVEMIEEDRKAGRQHKDIGDKLGVRPFNHNDRPVFGRR